MRSFSLPTKVLIALVLVGLGLMTVFGQRARVAEDTARMDIVRQNEVIASFTVELALTTEQQVQGLMGRESLPQGTGMLFVFPYSGMIGMWMQNMRIPLDFLFISEDGRVVHMEQQIPPCPSEGPCPTISSPIPVKHVLEIPSGSIAELGLAVGDTIQLTAQNVP